MLAYLTSTTPKGRLWAVTRSLLALIFAALIGFASSLHPLAAPGIAGFGALAMLAFFWTEGLILAFFFLLYSNSGSIATNIHGIPALVVYPLLIGLMLVPLAKELLIRRQSVVTTPALPWILLFLASQACGAMFAVDPLASGAAVTEFMAEGLILYLLVVNVVRTPETLRRTLWMLLIAGALMGAVPLLQQITGNYHNDFLGYGQLSSPDYLSVKREYLAEGGQPRLAGAIGEQNRFSQVMLMFSLVALVLFSAQRSWWGKGWVLLAGILSGMGCVLAFSRGTAIAFVITIAVAGMLRIIKMRQFAALGVVVACFLVIFPHYVTRLVSISSVHGALTEEVTSEESRPDGATKGRLTEMIAAGMLYIDHPVLGVGPGMFKNYSQEYGNRLGLRHLLTPRESHSLFLGVAAETGTVGLVALVAAIFVLLQGLNDARHRWRDEHPLLANSATALLLALIGYLTAGLFLHFAFIRYFWVTMGLAGAACSVSKQLEEKEGN